MNKNSPHNLHGRSQRQTGCKSGEIPVLTAASMKMTVFWNVEPCSQVEFYRGFRGALCLHNQNPSANFYQTTRCNIPEDSQLNVTSSSDRQTDTHGPSVMCSCTTQVVTKQWKQTAESCLSVPYTLFHGRYWQLPVRRFSLFQTGYIRRRPPAI
jgi:hypothetical protein